jgi:hypothetical protein
VFQNEEQMMIGSKTLLVALLSAGVGAATLQAVHAASPIAPIGVSPAQNMDDYPHMQRALDDLHQAKKSLLEAEPKFKGHRDRAIDHVDAAIKECEDALAEG